MSDKLHFTVYFDGTGNNKDVDTPKSAHSNVARLYEADQAKGTNLAHNSGHEPQQYDAHDRSGQSEKIYFDGVGSQPNVTLRSLTEGGTGLGSQARIDQAYDAIVAFHNKYPDQKVDVNIVGFSRGAAQSRALANQLIERGVPRTDEFGKPTGGFLIPPGDAHINKLAIFDTVASYGYAISDTHLGKKLAIGKNVGSTTHMVAMNEYRETFRLTSALRKDDNSRIEELKFAGAHSQVGGGYPDDVLAAGPYAVMYNRLQMAGVQMGPMQQADIQNIQKYNNIINSPEKVQQALIDSRLRYGDKAFSQNADGTFQKVDNTPFPMERGYFNARERQRQPFDHQTSGRGVLFENDDSLSRLQITRTAEYFGSWLNDLGRKVLSSVTRFVGKDEPKLALDEMLYRSERKLADSKAVTLEQSATLSAELKSSRPSAQYIESLNLQTVPIPGQVIQGQQNDSQTQKRSDSFKAMEQKARGLNPVAKIDEASESGHKAISGVVVDMDEHHILQKVGKTDQFVIHDRRDIDPNRTFQMGRSTAIVHSKGIGDLAGTFVAKMEPDPALANVMRR